MLHINGNVLSNQVSTITGIYNASTTSNLSLQTNNTSRLSILNSNGFVGIGNVAPTEMLHVTGNLLSNQVSAANGIYNAAATSNLSLRTNLVERMTILNTSGFMGVGTTTPTEMLHVNGNILSNKVTTTTGFVNSTSANLTLQTNNLDRVSVLSSNGNVGIGTSAPEEKLQITGGNLVLDNGNTPTIYTGIGTTELNRYLQFSNSKGAPSPAGVKAGGVLISDSYTYANPGKNDLIVKGKVAIGTPLSSNPNNYILAVNGGIGAKDVRVEKISSTWPDYVFHKNYALTPLTEVAKYIDENKHLQDVPSATEVEKNGHSLGDMDAILLKKVEELTLYIIQQQKEIEALKKRLDTKK